MESRVYTPDAQATTDDLVLAAMHLDQKFQGLDIEIGNEHVRVSAPTAERLAEAHAEICADKKLRWVFPGQTP